MIHAPKKADEAWFNSEMRSVLRAQGLQCAHVRETDTPGFSDLLIWAGSEIVAFVELKIDGKPLETSQVEFLRAQDAMAGNAYMFDLDRKEGIVRMWRGANPTWAQLGMIDETDALNLPWQRWFWDHRREDKRYR